MGNVLSTARILAVLERGVWWQNAVYATLRALKQAVIYATGTEGWDPLVLFRASSGSGGHIAAVLRYLKSLCLFAVQSVSLLVSPAVAVRQLIGYIALHALLLGGGWLSRLLARVRARFDPAARKRLELEARLRRAADYATWRRRAKRIDVLTGADKWRRVDESERYDAQAVRQRINIYRSLIDQSNVPTLMFMLRAGLLRRHWGMGDPSLFQHSLVGTKRVLEEYVETVAAALRAVSRSESAAPEDLNEKLAFFSETRHAYGRSALCLSGGATLGLWHVGVVLELRRQGLLPRVISGSSAGSIVTAIVGVRTDEELEADLTLEQLNFEFFGMKDNRTAPGAYAAAASCDRAGAAEKGGLEAHEEDEEEDEDAEVKERSEGDKEDKEEKEEEEEGFAGGVRSKVSQVADFLVLALPPPLNHIVSVARDLLPQWLQTRSFLDIAVLQRSLRANVGDLTFQEAYDRTGRIINITVTSAAGADVPALLNYLTAPNVLIWSAAAASCAIPGVFDAVELMAKDSAGNVRPYYAEGQRWIDGSVEQDLPMARLSELFNVNQFIVSQVNPHAPLLLSVGGSSPLRRLVAYLQNELKAFVAHFSELTIDTPGVEVLTRGLVPILTQKYQGDLTLMPRIGWVDVTQLLSNPSTDRLRHAVLEGRRMTWPHITWLRMHCLVEFTLEQCVHELRERLAGVDPSQDRGVGRASSFHVSRSIMNIGDLEPTSLPPGRAALATAGSMPHGLAAGNVRQRGASQGDSGRQGGSDHGPLLARAASTAALHWRYPDAPLGRGVVFDAGKRAVAGRLGATPPRGDGKRRAQRRPSHKTFVSRGRAHVTTPDSQTSARGEGGPPHT